jgi:flagellar export protein FliJ
VPDPLEVVLRVRRSTLDEAKRALSAALRVEAGAQRHAELAEALLKEEEEAASNLDLGDGAVEAYAAWLPVGRANAKAARDLLEQRSADVAIARAGLTLARTAAEAAESLLERRRAAREAERTRRAQMGMDEIASQTVARRQDGD